VEVPTVRESDGLAISSRNQHLSPDERRVATVLYQALEVAQKRIASGASQAAMIKKEAMAIVQQQPQVRLEYLEIVDPDQMQPVESITGPVRVVGAIWIGSTRLIDNLLCKPRRPP
jgi:pantoate--beta-alanine ligase